MLWMSDSVRRRKIDNEKYTHTKCIKYLATNYSVVSASCLRQEQRTWIGVNLPVDWDALGSIYDALLLLGRGSSLVVPPWTVQRQRRRRRNYNISWSLLLRRGYYLHKYINGYKGVCVCSKRMKEALSIMG